MKARWALIFFATGLGAGWLIFGGGLRASAQFAGNNSAASVVRKREARPVKSPHEAKFRSFAKELPSLSEEEMEAFKKSLAPGDRPAAVDALLAQAGPYGLPGEVTNMISEILKTWAGEDFDGAWDWCRRIESDANRNFIASELLDQLVDKDPDRALALHLEMVAEGTGFDSRILFELLRQVTTKDAASFLNFLGKLPSDYNDQEMPVEFAADFNFQQAADGIVALRKNQKAPIQILPNNLLSSWATRDADAAYAWFSKNGNLPRENFGNLLEGIEKQGNPGASYSWAADKINEPGCRWETMIHALADIRSDENTSVINGIAQAMPDTANRDRFLGDVVMMNHLANPVAHYGYALTQMSSPTARLETFQRLGKANKLFDAENIPDTQLQQWGITRQQVEQAQALGR
ncbi:MAG: hypothetical protein V4819_06535 [Verrucomicrobiota bacterium]